MFRDRVARFYDLFEDFYNGKVNRELAHRVTASIDPDAALSELLRVCRPGGSVIIPTTPEPPARSYVF